MTPPAAARRRPRVSTTSRLTIAALALAALLCPPAPRSAAAQPVADAAAPAQQPSARPATRPASRPAARLATRPAAARAPAPRPPNPAYARVADDPALPRVLLIGDSISIGYTVAVRDRLKGRANVHRPTTNCGPRPTAWRTSTGGWPRPTPAARRTASGT
jgi:hypothetical protein